MNLLHLFWHPSCLDPDMIRFFLFSAVLLSATFSHAMSCGNAWSGMSPLVLEVDTSKLRRFDDIVRPEAQRLSELTAHELEKALPQLTEEEMLFAIVPGLAGISKLQGFSDFAIGTERLRAWMPEYLVSALAAKGIVAEPGYGKDPKPQSRKTQVMFRIYLAHDDDSYGRDYSANGNTYSYQNSILQIHVRKITPPQASGPIAIIKQWFSR